MKNLLLTTVLMLAVIFSSNATNDVNGPAKKVSISGAGATFPLPFYNLAFKTYQDKTGNSITYGGIGSGGGIRSLKDKIVDFGGSDAYLSDKEMSEMPAAVVHIPTCMGAVVLAYNQPGTLSPIFTWAKSPNGTTAVLQPSIPAWTYPTKP